MKMWPLKAHCCLWFGSLSGILPFVFLFARDHLGMSATAVGALFSVLPFVAAIAKPLACSAADHNGKYSTGLLLSQVFALSGYGFMLSIPAAHSLLSNDALWYIFCLLALVANTSMGIGISLTDYLVMHEVNHINQHGGNTNYGNFRIWGTVGFGAFGILAGILNRNAGGSFLYLPGLIMFIVVEILDIGCVYRFYHIPRLASSKGKPALSQDENFQISKSADGEFAITNGNSNAPEDIAAYSPTTTNDIPRITRPPYLSRLYGNIKQTATSITTILMQILRLFYRYPSLLQHCFIIFCFGILTALHWSYFFWFLKDMRGDDSLLMGLCLFVNSFIGEIPIFLIAYMIIQRIGPVLSLCISLSAFGVRYLCYGYLIKKGTGVYWDVLLIETLQGLCFSLFYVCMTHVAQFYANKCEKMTAFELTETVENGHSSNLSNSRPPSVDDVAEGEFESNISGQSKMNSLRPVVLTPQCENKMIKPSATMQGLTSGCYEGLGLGVGSLLGGFLIDQISVFSIWRISGFFSLALVLFNLIIELIKVVRRKLTNGRAANDG